MALIVIDGPQAVGKTRMIDALSAFLPVHRVWSWNVIDKARNSPKFEAILRDTISAIGNGQLVIIEKSWAQTSLAAQLHSPQSGSSIADEFTAEWQFGRLVQLCGLRVMMLPSSRLIAEHRADSVKSSAVALERAIFANYAARWGWLSVAHEYTSDTFARAVKYIAQHIPQKSLLLDDHPGYCGPRTAPIVFVGNRDKEILDRCAGRFLPFSGELGTHLGAYFAQDSRRFGWAHARRIPPVALRSAKVLVAADDDAESWCWNHVGARDVRKLPNLRIMTARIKRAERIPELDRLLHETLNYEQGRIR